MSTVGTSSDRLRCRPLGWVAALVLALAPAGAAQQQLPRPNPLQGLRGAPSRGVATHGVASRGFSTRPITPGVRMEFATDGSGNRRPPEPVTPTGPRRSFASQLRQVDWLLDLGRVQQAGELLEQLLAASPDNTEVLDRLERLGGPVSVPADRGAARQAIETLLAEGAAAPLLQRELVVLQLRELGVSYRNDLEQALRVSLVDPAADRRLFATHALRRLFPGRAAGLLLSTALNDGTPAVRFGAARALGERPDPVVLRRLTMTLSGADERLRLHAAQTLGRMGDPHAVEVLVRRLESLVASGGSAVETRVVRDALRRLTGATVADLDQAWLAWWRTAGPQWLASQP